MSVGFNSHDLSTKSVKRQKGKRKGEDPMAVKFI